MTDPGAGTPPTVDAVSEQLTALVLKDEDVTTTRERSDSTSSFKIPPTPPSSLESPTYLRKNEENPYPPSRRPLFSSMREALESSGQLKEEPGGYLIKRHSGHQQQLRSADSGRSKHRHTKQRKDSAAALGPTEDEADAAGYTVIRRRSSCDESSSFNVSTSASSSQSQAARRNSSPKPRTNKKAQQQRPRRGSTSALPQSSLGASMTPPSSSVPPGFQPHPASRVLRPPPGLTPAASGWVVKAAAPAENANKIEEPPVEALWPEVKSTAKTDSGWAVATSESGLQAQAWATSRTSDQKDVDDDDLLARLGVTL